MLAPSEHYSISAVATALFSLIFSLWIRIKSSDEKLIKSFTIYSLAIGHWSAFVALSTIFSDPKLCYQLAVICHIGGIFIPILFLKFTCVYCGFKDKTINNFIKLHYLFFAVLAGTSVLIPGSFIASVSPKLSFNYFPDPGPLFYVWNFCFGYLVVVAHLVLFRRSRELQGNPRKATQVFFVANMLGYIGGVGCFFPVYGIDIFPFPYGIWGVFLFVAASAFAVMRYKLLPIETIVKRTTVYAALFAFIFGTFMSLTYLTNKLITPVYLLPDWATLMPTMLLITFTLRPLEVWLTEKTDKYLFQKNYDYKALLRLFTTEVLTVLDHKKVCDNTVNALAQIIKLDECRLFLKRSDASVCQQVASATASDTLPPVDMAEPLIDYMRVSGNPTRFASASNKKNKRYSQYKKFFTQIHSEFCIPIHYRNEFMGFIALGGKKSGDDFTKDDSEILSSIGRTVGIALTNSNLFRQLSETQAEVAQSEKMAVIGTLASGINHEICNPLGIVRGHCELFLLNLKEGLYDNLDREKLLKQCDQLFNKIIEQTDRATGITKRLSTFAKPNKMWQMTEVNAKEEIGEVLNILAHEMKINNIKINNQIPDDFPSIFVDKKQVQEVVFNIVRNAAQAMDGEGIITFGSVVNGTRATITIGDTGHGISKEKLEKIFNPFFTTKDPGKGTGLGLYIVKQIVEKNNGIIEVHSEENVGTTFSLTFDVFDSTKVKVLEDEKAFNN